jgi:hypothetical protein
LGLSSRKPKALFRTRTGDPLSMKEGQGVKYRSSVYASSRPVVGGERCSSLYGAVAGAAIGWWGLAPVAQFLSGPSSRLRGLGRLPGQRDGRS